MSFFFRHSINLGLFRINLSKSGIGISFGVRGARISLTPRGNYINLGAKGLYYRKKLNSRNAQGKPTTSGISKDWLWYLFAVFSLSAFTFVLTLTFIYFAVTYPLFSYTVFLPIALILWLLFAFGCFLIGTPSNQFIETGQKIDKKLAAIQNKIDPKVSAPPYEKLTADSTYYDVLKYFGIPDAEESGGDVESPLHVMWIAYKKFQCVVLLAYTQEPQNKKYNRSFTRYVGIKGINPERVIHSANERCKTLLEATQLQSPHRR